MKIRLAKFIADSGVASRRDAERLIESGAVIVNGVKINTPVFFVDGSEEVKVNNKIISPIINHQSLIYAFHKPINTMTTARDPMGRKTIYDVLPAEYKNLKYIGRLDYKTTGLLLLTNDGDLARKLTLPSSNIPRTYVAECGIRNGASGIDTILKPARNGITVDGVHYRPMKIDVIKSNNKICTLNIEITEGKKNEVRIVLGAIGLPVMKLHRVSFGAIKLGNLPAQKIQCIDQKTIDLMLKSF